MTIDEAIKTKPSKTKEDKMNKYRIINHRTKEEVIVEANSAQEAARQVGCRIKEVSPIDIGQPKLSGMTIDEAIEILAAYKAGSYEDTGPDLDDALDLGREALKGIKAVRQLHPELSPFPLPGETKAVDQRTANIGYGSSEALKKQRR